MVKTLSDVCLDYICNAIRELDDICSALTLEQKADVLQRLVIHQKLSDNLFPTIKKHLFSHALCEITLQNCQQVNDKFLSLLGQSCLGLRSLKVINCYDVTDDGLKPVFQNLKKLKSVVLNGLPKLSGSCFTSASCQNLCSADLQQNYNIGDTEISALVQNCNKIRYLNLFSCQKLTDVGLDNVAGFLLGRLEHLNCSYITGITDVTLISLADRCFSLKCLKLHGCSRITSVGLRAVFKACPLSIADLSYCYELSKGPDILSDCLPISLSKLILRGTQASPEFLHSMSLRCNSIHTLKLCGIQSVNDDLICDILAKIGYGIENLDLSFCQGLTDVTLKTIIQHCTKLSKLAMMYCHLITGKPLTALMSNEKKKQATGLHKLALQACKKFDTSLLCGLLPHLPNLKYLGVSGQHLFSDDEMFSLAKNCTHLQKLNIKGCTRVTDSGICELVRFCSHLESLVLSGLHQLTDKSIFLMASSVSSILQFLYISGCSRISHPAVTYLKDVCTKLLFVEHKVPNAAPDQLMAKNLDTGEFCRADLIHHSSLYGN
ncbi:F-box/LRR-repeat protein 2-like [Rhopilema esculentum]|uniref:F-box/LRR-repeat protein 2-like n=1 Tax=Rhopilema esculentum TaxID=499914 RepID=UPI0031DFB028|eukprot:gene12508-3193_t